MKSLISLSVFLFTCICSFAQNSVSLIDGSMSVISIHQSITDAYAAIPATLTQPYIIRLNNGYNSANETFPITFTSKAGASASNTISIVQGASANFQLVVSKDSTKPIFLFDDADYIILGGTPFPSWNSGISVVYDASNPERPAIELKNGACNNTLTNLIFYGGTPQDTLPSIGIMFGKSDGNVSGNSNNTVKNCMTFDLLHRSEERRVG